MEHIPLANGKVATFKSTRVNRIPDINPDEDISVHTYQVPCPVCDCQDNLGHSQDGIFFLNNQLTCRGCGVFFRPIVDPSFVSKKLGL